MLRVEGLWIRVPSGARSSIILRPAPLLERGMAGTRPVGNRGKHGLAVA